MLPEPPRNFKDYPDDLWKLLPMYASTALEKNLLTAAPFQYIFDPHVKVLKRGKGDWLGWHTLSDDRGRLILDANAQPQIIHDANFWVLVGGQWTTQEPQYSERYLIVGDDSFLYWLAVEYGVNYLSEILPDVSDRIVGGIALNRIAGTPAAIKLVMGWLNFPDATIVEETAPTVHFPEYQLNLGRYPTSFDEIQTVVRSVRFAEPTRSRLRRVFYEYDVGRFILDSSDWGDILDDYSDFHIDDLLVGHPQVKASFRRPSTDTVATLVPQWDSSATRT